MYTCTLYRKTVCLHSKFYRETSIGSDEAANDIVLKGGLIEANHCVIHLKEGKLFSRENAFISALFCLHCDFFTGIATLIPNEDAMCTINAVNCQKPTRLYQGCVIVLGKTNMFR